MTCHKCVFRAKRVTGATPAGTRNAMICHWAINHKELKTVMLDDPDVDDNFVNALFFVSLGLGGKNLFNRN